MLESLIFGSEKDILVAKIKHDIESQ